MSCCGQDPQLEENTSSDTVKVRYCTDVFWLAIYICLWFLMILIAGFAYVYGNPRRLVNGYDSFGNTCGSSHNEPIANFNLSGLDMTSRSYLFFMDIKNIGHSFQLCVKKCPDRDLMTLNDIKIFYQETGSSLCRYDFDLNESNTTEIDHGLDEKLFVTSPLGLCPPLPVYKSTPILNRCIPVAATALSKEVIGSIFAMLNSWDIVEQVLGDLYVTLPYLVGLSFFALFLSMAVISIFYLFTSIVAYIIMLLVSISSLVGTSFLWWTYFNIKNQLDNTPDSELLDEAVQNERAFLIYSIIATIMMLIILLLVYSMRKRVDFVSDLFKEAADCLSAVPCLYLQPIICFIELIAFYIFWVSVIVCLATANYPGTKFVRPFTLGIPETELSSTVPSQRINSSYLVNGLELYPVNISIMKHKVFTFVQYTDATWVRYMWWVYLISLVWTSEFLLSCQQMVIAGAVARWYFNGWKKTEKSPVLKSFRHLFSYHLGSAALGSLLIVLFKLPRLILSFLYAKLKKNDNVVNDCVDKCCFCCFWSLENFIRYINHNAYTIVAIQGINFCEAAVRAFNTLASNALQLATINTVGDFILFLGKVIVTAVTGSVGLILLKNHHPDLHFYSAPTLVICVFSYFIAHSVISLYEIVIDTLFLCVCEDKNMNDGNGFWRQSTLATITSNNGNTRTNQAIPELSPMNS